MKTFYTNIQHLGDKINVRAIVDGKREKYIEEFNPVVFVPTGRPTKFETLDNVKVDSIRPGTISETRAFIERNKKFAVPTYGYSEWSHQYIAENFDGCDYDLELIRICNIDIEVASEHGFPGVEDVREEIVAITFHDSLTQKYYVFGNSTFINNREDVDYYEADDEEWFVLIYIKINSPDDGIEIEDISDPEKNISHEFKSIDIFKASDTMVDSLTQLIARKRDKNIN